MTTMTAEQIEAILGPGWVEDVVSRRLIFTEAIDWSPLCSVLGADPWPHLVHYQKGRVIYTAPDEFLTWTPHGPSDCTWIVPGTGEQKP